MTIPNDCLLLATAFAGNPYPLTRANRSLSSLRANAIDDSWQVIEQAKYPLLATYISEIPPNLSTSEKMKRVSRLMRDDLPNFSPGPIYIHPFALEQRLKDASLQKAWPNMRAAIIKAGWLKRLPIPPENAKAKAIRNWFAKNPDLSKVTYLDLSNLTLVVIPKEIRRFTHLEALLLKDNLIRDIPPYAFRGLKRLFRLDLSHNRIQELPEIAFRDLTKIAHINLSYNRIVKLPERIFQGLTSLTAINLGSNRLQTLPENLLRRLANLVYLELACNDLETLPQGIFQGTPRIESLYLSSNLLSYLPDNLFHPITALQLLDLRKNQLQELHPRAFQNLNQLKYLLLSDNRLHQFPGRNLPLPPLQFLDLSNNELHEIPTALTTLPTLNDFRHANNHIPVQTPSLSQRVRSMVENRHFYWLQLNAEIDRVMRNYPKVVITAAMCALGLLAKQIAPYLVSNDPAAEYPQPLQLRAFA